MRELAFIAVALISSAVSAAEVLVEAESFAESGGWVLDSQFLDVMGSPYLLAHGLGKPVANAVTEVEFPETGTYRLWVRTKDWVPSRHPGRFKVIVDGREVPAVFGDRGQGWVWQDGGNVDISRKRVRIELKDLTHDHDKQGGLTHFWEYGQRLDPFKDAEEIRDHLFCAIYGTFATAKRMNPEKNAKLELERVGHVPAGGESRRLIGDYILTENDVRSGKVFPDAAALCSGHFCLHYPAISTTSALAIGSSSRCRFSPCRYGAYTRRTSRTS